MATDISAGRGVEERGDHCQLGGSEREQAGIRREAAEALYRAVRYFLRLLFFYELPVRIFLNYILNKKSTSCVCGATWRAWTRRNEKSPRLCNG